MPSYEYREAGRVVVRVLPVADRDRFPGRVTVPSRVAVCPRGAPSQETSAMTGLHKQERLYGSEFGKRWPFSVAQTRKAWGKNRSTDN